MNKGPSILGEFGFSLKYTLWLLKHRHEYDAFIIDLWGVMHNGIKLNSSAINTVRELEANGKRVVFLSNAPRPVSYTHLTLPTKLLV